MKAYVCESDCFIFKKRTKKSSSGNNKLVALIIVVGGDALLFDEPLNVRVHDAPCRLY